MGNRKPRLGDGIYTASDAAKILRIPFKKSKDWFQYYVKHRLFDTVGYRYYFDISDVVAVDFLTLITMAVFFSLKEKRITSKHIIKVHQNMSKQLNTPYPFANKDIYTVGNKIFWGQEHSLIRGDSGQPTIPDIFFGFAEKLEFNEKRLAHKFYPLTKSKTIVVNPKNQFGLPTIDGTNILTDTIYDMVCGGVDKQEICKSYGIKLENIEDVIEFSKAA